MTVPDRTVETAQRAESAYLRGEAHRAANGAAGIPRVLAAIMDPATVAPDGQPLGDDALVRLGDVVFFLRYVDWQEGTAADAVEGEFPAWVFDREARR